MYQAIGRPKENLFPLRGVQSVSGYFVRPFTWLVSLSSFCRHYLGHPWLAKNSYNRGILYQKQLTVTFAAETAERVQIHDDLTAKLPLGNNFDFIF